MEFECCDWLFSEIFAWMVISYFLAPILFLIVVLPVKLFLTGLGFLFYRYTAEPQGVFDAAVYVLQEIAKRFGGVFYAFTPKRAVCLLPSSNLFVEVERTIGVQLRIHKDLGHKKTIWKKWLRCGEVTGDQMIGWIKTAEISAEERSKLPVHSLEVDQRCAYCKEWLEAGHDCIRCFQCSAPHHLDCFRSNAGCAVFGCDLQRAPATMGFARSTHGTVKSHIVPDPCR
jgi:hypothetical protein